MCTYSCVYCQLGRTKKIQVDRGAFYDPQEILKAVQEKVARTREMGDSIDYLTFVPDGEPTVDTNLGHEIESLSSLKIKTAVISNASLIWREDVREDLKKADWVSLKVDSADGEVWRRMNRPYGALRLESILAGILEFAKTYKGDLTTETMLVKGVNDSSDHVSEIADFLAQLRPVKAYLSIPTRPPSEKWVQPPGEGIISQGYRILQERINRVECLMEYEGNAFAFTGNVIKDLLGITAVHPMRKDAVQDFLERAGANWSIVESLITEEQLSETEHRGQKFYKRQFPKQSTANEK
jgi:wyosine [tRNA(Phe)-imidazoG37] synthetase (radical SAM superfamily)